MKSLALFIILFILWLLMSGHYTFLITSLGIISCLLCVYLAKRAKLIDDEGLPLSFFPRLISYLLWLFKEIINSNYSTAKTIINGKIDPEIFTIKPSQKSEVGKATYANSITLTPGTVTTQIDKNLFEVHALNSDFGDDLRNGEMDKKVSWLEGVK
jgi:multicomponent Na+:H+ antiporter subunit E|tara:strand:+ start:461 stop:928 length:468 start_codon:yes stop_codon:yes gene_type:complete